MTTFVYRSKLLLHSLLLLLVLTGASTAQAMTEAQAARFLTQATFGATRNEIAHVMEVGFEAWLQEQFALRRSSHRGLLDSRLRALGIEVTDDSRLNRHQSRQRRVHLTDTWWHVALTRKDQLRQRVAFALSQILVVSLNDPVVALYPRGVAAYYDILSKNAFGNYETLLREVTLNPMMGTYLSMIRNEKPDPERNVEADENYARELMQLFTIGLVELEQDGAVRRGADGRAIETYDNDVIKNLARALTGWTWGNAVNFRQIAPEQKRGPLIPMKAFEAFHDKTPKRLLSGVVLAAGQSASQDLNAALTVVFNHPNVAPFVSKQLIQKLVTSNPSPAYVARVSQVFADNGDGVRGDLEAVIEAVLLDAEARTEPSADSDFGKLREPLLRLSALWRAFGARSRELDESEGVTRMLRAFRYGNSELDFAQRAMSAPSVFNFFSPSYARPGPISELELLSPEFEILNEFMIIKTTNRWGRAIFGTDSSLPSARTTIPVASQGFYAPGLDLRFEKRLASDAAALVSHLNVLLMAGQMSTTMIDVLEDFVSQVPLDEDGRRRVEEAVFMIASSPEFAVQR